MLWDCTVTIIIILMRSISYGTVLLDTPVGEGFTIQGTKLLQILCLILSS